MTVYLCLSEGSRLAMLRLRHLSPSVQCDNDSMSLQIKGSQVPKFLVETREYNVAERYVEVSNLKFRSH